MKIQKTKYPLGITQHAKGVGVLPGIQEYEETQRKTKLLQDVQKSVTQINEGKGIEHGDAKKMVLSKLRKSQRLKG